MNNCNNDRVFVISKEKSKQFLEDRKKNVISPEFLEKCLDYNRLFGKGKVVVSMEESLEDIIPIDWSEVRRGFWFVGVSRVSL